MSQATPANGVGAVIVDEGRILLVERGHSPAKGAWTVPGGHVERGETPEQAVIREVFEETGLAIEVGPIAWQGVIGEGNERYEVTDFHAYVTGGALRAGSDANDVRWVALSEVAGLRTVPTMLQLIDTLVSEAP